MSSLPPEIATPPRFRRLPVGLGMASLVLGVIGAMFAFFPVLGTPISALGLFFGLLGLLVPRFRFGMTLRWTLAGVVLCAAALAANLAVAYAPWGYIRNQNPPQSWQQPPDRPSNPAAEP